MDEKVWNLLGRIYNGEEISVEEYENKIKPEADRLENLGLIESIEFHGSEREITFDITPNGLEHALERIRHEEKNKRNILYLALTYVLAAAASLDIVARSGLMEPEHQFFMGAGLFIAVSAFMYYALDKL